MHPRTTRPTAPGFTLIELLIVVAIIAILAAIAVPNFLEAQTRSKVSRAKADMRSIATAVEAYRVDSNQYAIPGREDGTNIAGPPFTEWFETRVPTRLTTPVTFLSGLLIEPFPDDEDGESPMFHYASRHYVLLTEGGDEEFYDLLEDNLVSSRNVHYYLLSHGPDKDHDLAPGEGHHHEDEEEVEEEHDHGDAEPGLYDPTNGTLSNGDIVYFGPGLGYLN